MRTAAGLVRNNQMKVSKARPWPAFREVRVVNSTYWLCMIQRVLMKPFLDHLNCNRDKLGWVTKQQWAMSLKGQTDTYWFSHIISLILLSKQADSHSSPSRPICPNSALWRLLPLSIQIHTPTDACRLTFSTCTHIWPEVLWEFFLLHCADAIQRGHVLAVSCYRFIIFVCEGNEVCVCVWVFALKKKSDNMQTAIDKLVLTSSEEHIWWQNL